MNTGITHLPLEVIRVDEAGALPPSDIVAIHELLSRVFLAEDSRDPDALRQCVTTDLSHHHSLYGTLHGQEVFVNWVVSNPQFFDGLRHQAVNIVTASEGPNRARAVSYLLVFQLYSTEPGLASALPRLIAHGVVRDRLVKEDRTWRIAVRIYDQISILGSLIPDSAIRLKASEHIPL